ncbi:hypothetical protein L226DRAFT_493382 [Lentinus tigrinus ALCF2SS1-7]|uniref:F-box domain-containing protein n=1 Tax=Lentinus tigrinus ALCF2SS1-6 TaxID=1328759 RepID=A0A5C2RX32_9APHY|nr:hypothetical protein L227DRAFT_312437 [Lentinus tigrinus ALCF2SS1-6]RPD70166.1 hypothetical protein L226DRAFT_493382 [Lentinus tigrinus ALCF2SS1-7]
MSERTELPLGSSAHHGDSDAILHPDALQGPYYGLKALITTTQGTDTLQLLIRVDDVRRDLLSICALANASAAANTLPNEILLSIFLHIQGMVEEGTAPHWPAVLLVCRRWFVVAATAPQLWRELVVGKSLNLLRTGIVRSKGLTLRVFATHRDAVAEVAQTITPHVHRIQTLSFSSIHQRHKTDVASLLQHPMPALERLNAIIETPVTYIITQDDPWLGIDNVPLTRENFPKLRSLVVERIIVRPSSAIYQQLSVLHLLTLEGRLFDYCELRKILRTCQNVEDLALEFTFRRDEDDLDRDQVVLPRLRKLHLSGSRVFLHDILETIATPETADSELAIHLSDAKHDYIARKEGISSALPQDYQTLLPIFSAITEVHAQARQSEEILLAYAPAADGATHGCRRLSLRMPVYETSKAPPDGELRSPDLYSLPLRDLRVFSSAPVETLRIDTEAEHVHYVHWPAILEHFPLLRALSVTVCDYPGDTLPVLYAIRPTSPSLEVTAYGETLSHPAQRAPCSRLRTLRMSRFRATRDPFNYSEPWAERKVEIVPAVAECLVSRARDGCETLEELVLDLDCMDERKWGTAERRRMDLGIVLQDSVREHLVTGKMEYTERQSWRERFTYEAS